MLIFAGDLFLWIHGGFGDAEAWYVFDVVLSGRGHRNEDGRGGSIPQAEQRVTEARPLERQTIEAVRRGRRLESCHERESISVVSFSELESRPSP